MRMYSDEIPVYRNSAKNINQRVKDLLSRMTLEEKITQLSMTQSLEDNVNNFPANGFGFAYMAREISPEIINQAQRLQVENTRLGIPFLMAGESLHGLMFTGATIFPQAIAMGATFNRELFAEIASVIGKEARAVGIRQVFAPNIDISQDPRWGRTEENFGEDPYLTGQLGVEYIKALQEQRVAATPKHYLAHGCPEGGINCAPSRVGERQVREMMLEPFRDAVREGKAMSIMAAYSELDGIPMHISSYWLTDVLRKELGFDGFVTSDSGALELLVKEHFVAQNIFEAGEMAFSSGVDVELPGPSSFGEELKKAIEDYKIPMERVDEAVSRVLKVKFQLGLFEEPYAQIENLCMCRSKEAVDLAKQAATESVVLLKNDNILPLDSDIKKIAVVGPNAGYAQLGGYTTLGSEKFGVSLKDGLIARLGKDSVLFAKGCNISTEDDYSQAVDAANNADVTVVVLGDNSSCWFDEKWGDTDQCITCGENFDSSTLQLPSVQKELLKRIKATGKPVILVLVTGRPYVISEDCELANAVLQAFYPGEQGGNALTDLIFGDSNPSGKLPISFPRSIGHIPCFYNYKPSSRGRYHSPDAPDIQGTDKLKENPAALYPFGYGLSYTSFKYTNLRVQGNQVSVVVTNIGIRSGKETVMLFVKLHTCPVTPFVKRLRGFEKIHLEPGEGKEVIFSLCKEDLSYIGEDMKSHLGKGKVSLSVGDLTIEVTIDSIFNEII